MSKTKFRALRWACAMAVLLPAVSTSSTATAAATPTYQPQLVKDINEKPDLGISSLPEGEPFVVVGSTIFYAYTTPTEQMSLYKASTTPAGSSSAAVPATDADGNRLKLSYPQFLLVGSTVYFAADNGVSGQELWKSDGTTAGTVLVKDIRPGSGPSFPEQLTIIGSTIYFTAYDATNGQELWKSDGTGPGTSLVKNISPGSSWSFPSQLTAVDSTLFFTADDGTNGQELWKSDGSGGGTVMVKNIYSGDSSSNPVELTAVGSTLYFAADNGVNGQELWKSGGSAGNTSMVEDLESGSWSSYPTQLTAAGSKLFFVFEDFVYGRELWVSDGTAIGTDIVKDIFTGTYYDDFGDEYPLSSSPSGLTAVGSTLFFAAYDGSNGSELWKTDGSGIGTVMVKDIASGTYSDGVSEYPMSSEPGDFAVVGSTLYFSADDGTNGRELWKSGGSAGNTSMVKDVLAGASSSKATSLIPIGSLGYFAALSGSSGWEIWKTDSTDAGTVMVTNVRGGTLGSEIYSSVSIGSTLYFTADDGIHGSELWKSDGTTAGTVMVKDINPASSEESYWWYSGVFNLTAVGSTLYFTADDGINGRELWKSDGTAAGTVMVKDLTPGSYEGGPPRSSYPSSFTAVGSTLYFTATDEINGYELWKSDGTAAGTVLVKDIEPGVTSSGIWKMTPAGSTLFFTADTTTNGEELWKSDGTSAGTTLVKEIAPGGSSSSPGSLTAIGSTLFFSAYNGTYGDELWKSDGTDAGTAVVKDIKSGSNSSYPSNMMVFGSKLYFAADDGTNGRELWRSDGTTAGTTLFKDITAGASSSYPWNMTAVGSTLFFSADDSVHGEELWKSDGTPDGTSLVKDILPGNDDEGFPLSSMIWGFTPSGSTLFFTADDGIHGYELWSTNGTEAGTTLVSDIASGAGSSFGYWVTIARTSNYLFMNASTDTYGMELWALDIRNDDAIFWSPALSTTADKSPHNLGSATSTSNSTVTYTVTSTGSASCAISNSSLPIVTFGAAGSCTVSAATADSPGYRGASSTVTLVVGAAPAAVVTPPATTPTTVPVTTVTTKTLPSLTPKKQVSTKSLLSYFGVKPVAKSKTTLVVAASSKSVCKVSGTNVKYLKAGNCSVTLTVTPPKGKGKAKSYKAKLVGKAK